MVCSDGEISAASPLICIYISGCYNKFNLLIFTKPALILMDLGG